MLPPRWMNPVPWQMRMKRILIINADDLGYTTGINRAVRKCADDGVLHSTTLMANGPAFEEAVSMFRGGSLPGVGIHITLTELQPLSPPKEIPGLVDSRGFLPSGPSTLLDQVCSGRISFRVLRTEVERQVARVLDSGITPTHLDSHKHVHVIPSVLDAMVEVALQYSIGWIRNPFDRTSIIPVIRHLEPGHKGVCLLQHARARLVRVFQPRFVEKIRKAGLRTPDHFYGVSLTGLWNESVMVRLLPGIPPGITEWMLHPGDQDGTAAEKRFRLYGARERERDLLLSPLWGELLAGENILLTKYGERFE